MALTKSDIENLEALLFSDSLEEEALDYFGVHGLICSSIVGPLKLSDEMISSLIFGSTELPFNQQQIDFLHTCIKTISESLHEDLMQGSEIILPYSEEVNNEEDTHYDACLESWCTGFMEGFFHNEEAWFNKGEDVAAELLLPIMALSGLFESDEFQEIRANDKLMSQFEEIMPDQLVDVFLFYHSE